MQNKIAATLVDQEVSSLHHFKSNTISVANIILHDNLKYLLSPLTVKNHLPACFGHGTVFKGLPKSTAPLIE